MQLAFSVWPVAEPVVGEMEMHSVANLATLQTPLKIFFPFKKAPKPYVVSPALPREHEVLLSQRTHTSLSLSLSLSVRLLCSACDGRRRRGAVLLVKHRYYVASLILHASITEITAQLLSLFHVYLISLDDGSFIRNFVPI